MRVVILMPVFNDWEAAGLVLRRLGEVLASGDERLHVSVVLADDCSTAERPAGFPAGPVGRLGAVEVLRLRRNLGHQRAIAVGLCHIFEHHPCDAVLVMDADGEDRPEDVPRLISRFEELGGREVVFAARTKRSERLAFRLLYRAYCHLHQAATGITLRFGNFSIMPHRALGTIVVVGELWNHYTAAVVKARILYHLLPTPRGTRASGQSHMNFTALLAHGLSAVSVFSDTVAVRATAAAFGLFAGAVAALVVAVIVRLGSGWTGAGWVAAALGGLAVALFQVLCVSFGLTVFLLHGRRNLGCLPLRDYAPFVEGAEQVAGRAGGEHLARPPAAAETSSAA